MGFTYNKLLHTYGTGTTCATANDTAAVKLIIPKEFVGNSSLMPVYTGEGVYLEGGVVVRDGINFPTAITAGPAVNPAYLVGCRLTDDLYVFAYDDGADGNDGKAFAISTSGTTPTVGTEAEFEDGGCTDIAIMRINDTMFAVSYMDSGDSDYVKVVIGTVDGTTITYGTICSSSIAGEPTKGMGICSPYSGVLTVAFQNAAAGGNDGVLYSFTYDSDYTLTFVSTGQEFDQTAPDYIQIVSYYPGYVCVVYRDTGDSNKIHAWGTTVSSAGVIGAFTGGTEKTLVNAAGTLLKAYSPQTYSLVVSYVDASSDGAVIATTVNTASPIVVATGGTAITPLGAGTHTGACSGMIDNLQGIFVADDGTYLRAMRFAKSGTTLTADSKVDTAIEGRYANNVACACGTDGKVVIVGEDASNVMQVVVGKYYENQVVDMRSTAASAAYKLWVFPADKSSAITM